MTTNADVTAGVSVTSDARRTDTRERILDTAAELFSERGYAATSVRDIAERLDVTKAALYYHFSSKAEILHALADTPVAAVRELLAQGLDVSTPDARRAYVRAVLEALTRCPPAAVRVFKDPDIQRQLGIEVSTSGITDALSLELARGLSGGEHVDSDAMLRAVGAVAAGEAMLHAWHTMNPDSGPMPPDAIEQLTEVVARALED